MASNPTLSSTSNADGTYTVTVGFTLTPAETIHETLSINSGPVATEDISVPAEAFPSVKIAGDPTIGPNDYVLSTSAGTLSKIDQANFKLQP